jgi:hypothetical protein
MLKNMLPTLGWCFDGIHEEPSWQGSNIFSGLYFLCYIRKLKHSVGEVKQVRQILCI